MIRLRPIKLILTMSRFKKTPTNKSRRQPKTAQALHFDHKDVKTLSGHLNRYGQIESRYKTKLKEMQQRHLSRAVKRARHLALLPFVNRD